MKTNQKPGSEPIGAAAAVVLRQGDKLIHAIFSSCEITDEDTILGLAVKRAMDENPGSVVISVIALVVSSPNAKDDIAAELAHRDAEIARLRDVCERAMTYGLNGSKCYSAREACKVGDDMRDILANAQDERPLAAEENL
ncbi:MAG: hypothetical protein WCS65_16405 [Verrucomicrobiae bacterium]